MRLPLSSVVIPAYNSARLIEPTLQSVLNQTYRHLEVIVVDDGSTDGTRSIANAVASRDARVRVISVANGGVASARNIGIAEAKGEYIAFLDSDDLWHPTKIERQIGALSRADATATYSYSRMIDQEGRVIADLDPVAFEGYSFARHMYARPVGNGSNIMVRREVLDEVGWFDESFQEMGLEGCEDLDLELRIALKYPLTSVRLYLVGYRWSTTGISSDRVRMSRAALATADKLLNLHPSVTKNGARLARAGSLEYAFNNMVFDHRRWSAASYFARLLWADTDSAIRLLADHCATKWNRTRMTRCVAPGAPPLFYEMAPDVEAGTPAKSIFSSRRKQLEQLARIDALLAPIAQQLEEREACRPCAPLRSIGGVSPQPGPALRSARP